MNRFIQNPNFPNAPVRRAAIGQRYSGLFEKPLSKLGVELFALAPCISLPEPVRSHADLQLHHLGGADFLFSSNGSIPEWMTELGLNVGRICEPGSHINHDAALCALRIGGLCFHNRNHTHVKLRQALDTIGVPIIHVRQAYARCTVCVVTATAAITADAGLYKALIRHGIETLLIDSGFIDLPGYDYGFIGGASFLLSNNLLAFAGSLDKHPNGREIRNFAFRHQVDTIDLTSDTLADIGTIVPIE